MDIDVSDFFTQQQHAPATAGEKKSDRQPPTGKVKVPGYPEHEAAWWVAPAGSKNAGAVFASVYRIQTGANGKRRTLRTFPVAGGGLVANVLGTAVLLDRFSEDASFGESDRKLMSALSIDVMAAVVKHLSPNAKVEQAQKTAEQNAPSETELKLDQLLKLTGG